MSIRDLRYRFVDSPGSLAEQMRQRRWHQLQLMFPQLESWSVLDLGGTVESWTRAPVQPRSLHVVNILKSDGELPGWVREDAGDACELPDGLLDAEYDLVFSNSVIEHVGGHHRREAFARQVQSVSPRHWIQTPYRYFPVEPHWVAPFMQFLPLRLRALYGTIWPLSPFGRCSLRESMEAQMSIELLDVSQMQAYFPDSEIRRERVLGLAKSLIAVRT